MPRVLSEKLRRLLFPLQSWRAIEGFKQDWEIRWTALSRRSQGRKTLGAGRLWGSPSGVLRPNLGQEPEEKEQDCRQAEVTMFCAEGRSEAPRTAVAVLPKHWLLSLPKSAETFASMAVTIQREYSEPGTFTYISAFNLHNNPRKWLIF